MARRQPGQQQLQVQQRPVSAPKPHGSPAQLSQPVKQVVQAVPHIRSRSNSPASRHAQPRPASHSNSRRTAPAQHQQKPVQQQVYPSSRQRSSNVRRAATEPSGNRPVSPPASSPPQPVTPASTNARPATTTTTVGGQSPPKTAAQAAAAHYAGPTFHSSPAASALPLPAFMTKSLPSRKAGAEVAGQLTDRDMNVPVDESPLAKLFRADRDAKNGSTSPTKSYTPTKQPILQRPNSDLYEDRPSSSESEDHLRAKSRALKDMLSPPSSSDSAAPFFSSTTTSSVSSEPVPTAQGQHFTSAPHQFRHPQHSPPQTYAHQSAGPVVPFQHPYATRGYGPGQGNFYSMVPPAYVPSPQLHHAHPMPMGMGMAHPLSPPVTPMMNPIGVHMEQQWQQQQVHGSPTPIGVGVGAGVVPVGEQVMQMELDLRRVLKLA
ncbi:hypothetical protein SAICODRAFT_138753 [Saitoella complicata NRRL Y-17804]|uniref:uncharacterized protein n=1 Tax=Saitoella complicata (strain BCRC 22490 / CBS 7301 / JCM 7358 / NBRC 10748 / NRRL Y-17804) TaxID=698492 RepID=UPI000866C5B7|nr:uncharacterized protein SAICODRAFT_138753 [Saitoella complicata NRRL Y-17804]ODQ51860.1 hypothetical protein SAICODRAFT_138753 [Saitoella complicata NRRL Y-17804]